MDHHRPILLGVANYIGHKIQMDAIGVEREQDVQHYSPPSTPPSQPSSSVSKETLCLSGGLSIFLKPLWLGLDSSYAVALSFPCEKQVSFVGE
jgi:hypothetical protein